MHAPGTVDVAVGWAVELGRVGFERMRAELFDINRDRRGQSLRAQHVESCRRAVGVREKGQPVFCSRLVGGDKGWGVLNGGIGSGEMSDPSLPRASSRSGS